MQTAQPSGTKSQPASGAPAATAAKIDPEKEKAIRHLMELTGTSKLGDNMTQAVSSQVKNAASRNMSGDRLQKFADDFNQKLTVRGPATEVATAQIPIYAQHFSMEDLQGMIQFYESPVGQRVMKVFPQVIQESQQAGASIERSAAIATLQEMSGDYPEIKPMLPQEQRPSLAPGTQPQPQSPKPSQLQPLQPQNPQPQL